VGNFVHLIFLLAPSCEASISRHTSFKESARSAGCKVYEVIVICNTFGSLTLEESQISFYNKWSVRNSDLFTIKVCVVEHHVHILVNFAESEHHCTAWVAVFHSCDICNKIYKGQCAGSLTPLK
jgi:hypothetical protein